MPLNTINLTPSHERAEISALVGIHNIEPAGSFKDPCNGDLYWVFVSNGETINILNDVQLAEESAQKLGEYSEQDVLCKYVEERLLRSLPEINEAIEINR